MSPGVLWGHRARGQGLPPACLAHAPQLFPPWFSKCSAQKGSPEPTCGGDSSAPPEPPSTRPEGSWAAGLCSRRRGRASGQPPSGARPAAPGRPWRPEAPRLHPAVAPSWLTSRPLVSWCCASVSPRGRCPSHCGRPAPLPGAQRAQPGLPAPRGPHAGLLASPLSQGRCVPGCSCPLLHMSSGWGGYQWSGADLSTHGC